jgi:hypothetical protein
VNGQQIPLRSGRRGPQRYSVGLSETTCARPKRQHLRFTMVMEESLIREQIGDFIVSGVAPAGRSILLAFVGQNMPDLSDQSDRAEFGAARRSQMLREQFARIRH